MSKLFHIGVDTDLVKVFAGKKTVLPEHQIPKGGTILGVVWEMHGGATVTIKRVKGAPGKGDQPFSIYIQAMDAYGYQREVSADINPNSNLILQNGGRHPDTCQLVLYDCEMVVYTHPGRRTPISLRRNKLQSLINRLEARIASYPFLLFHDNVISADGRLLPKNSGFVNWHEDAHRGTASLTTF